MSAELRLNDELVQKVRMIEFSVRRIVDDMMSGQYRSHFKGTGMQFSEHRQYYAGDDVRHIDWNTSARSRDLLVKKFEEERELNVLLVVDVSGSEHFGSQKQLKSEILAELGGMLASAAIHTGDKVGALLFAGEVEKTIRPKKGRVHVQRLIRDLLGHKTQTRGTDLKGALDAANRVLKHSGVVFVLSDFLAKDYELALRRLARRHEVVAVWLQDDRELEVPNVGTVLMEDPETGESRYVNTGSGGFRNWVKETVAAWTRRTEGALKGRHVDLLPIRTREDHGDALVRYFALRRRRIR